MKILHVDPSYTDFTMALITVDPLYPPVSSLFAEDGREGMAAMVDKSIKTVTTHQVPLVVIESDGIGGVFADMFVVEARKLPRPPLVVSHYDHSYFSNKTIAHHTN